MNSTGIVRRIDDLGRVVIPRELRRTFGISEGDSLEIYTEGNKIIISKYTPGCCLCGSERENLVPFYPEKMICKPCINLMVASKEKLLECFNTN